ncbi:f8cf62ff-9004-449f-a16b-cf7782419dc2 [Thermothielavioides terrestris]|uniref:F8cf62ff-9004-449f-a16b-cf7782419dc2 n=1 Tax=Thermothielavioides terrestris TaxID=2587410 RepID=A0A446B990_9PEZI|nr:f8cf62ff-9004-449f-a16b-cf7782419dc2 [Thermothielavioides terrestris]
MAQRERNDEAEDRRIASMLNMALKVPV